MLAIGGRKFVVRTTDSLRYVFVGYDANMKPTDMK
jgi:hypothetical protein